MRVVLIRQMAELRPSACCTVVHPIESWAACSLSLSLSLSPFSFLFFLFFSFLFFCFSFTHKPSVQYVWAWIDGGRGTRWRFHFPTRSSSLAVCIMMHWERVTREALFVFTPMGARTFQLQSVDAGDAFSPPRRRHHHYYHPLPYRVKKTQKEQSKTSQEEKRKRKKWEKNKIKWEKRSRTVGRSARGARDVHCIGRPKRKKRRETTNQLTAVYIHVQHPREIHL